MKLKLVQAVSKMHVEHATKVDGYPALIEELIYPWHKALADRYGYCYEVDYSQPPFHQFWMKAYMMLKAIDEGFDRVVWLDADAVWLHSALEPEFDTVFGATYHEMFWHPNHFNAGVLYLNCKDAKPVVEQWFEQRVHNFHDQDVLNANLSQHITKLDWEWNCHVWIPHYRVPDPRVAAWHGCPDRIPKIREFCQQYFEAYPQP